jgi:hypothetical protein
MRLPKKGSLPAQQAAKVIQATGTVYRKHAVTPVGMFLYLGRGSLSPFPAVVLPDQGMQPEKIR